MCSDLFVFSGKSGNLETPLMFSRCSSLGSVSDIEHQDDGHSSVVSEFRYKNISYMY